MANYKGYEVNDDLYSVVRYMPHVQSQRESLEQQQISWDYLSVMAQLANLENELSSARQQFNHLTGVLLNHLGLEALKKTINEYGSKAQVSINILVRNLFERTADIGFLATDSDIRDYLQTSKQSTAPMTKSGKRQALEERFKAYVSKYSVYDDVVLLDTSGHVLARLDADNPVQRSNAAFIKESISTDEAYVEYYGYSDLLPNQKNSLTYAYRVVAEETNEVLGVICLCFKFQNETQGIFQRLIENPSLENLVLLDKNRHVIATSKPEAFALGSSIRTNQASGFTTVISNGKEYLCCAREAEPYQGYAGAGWIGCVLLPINKVFKAEELEEDFSEEVLESAMLGNLFNEETKKIPVFANQIQSELNRSVWNGNVLQASEKNGPDAAVSKVLLSEIKNTGSSTKRIFENSVLEIQKTVIGTELKNSQSGAELAIDIMDRNLYERANDCRWWALDSTVRETLEKGQLTAEDQSKLQSVLMGINDLYTVYTNLIVYDQRGHVIAVSNTKYDSLVGKMLDAQWAKSVMFHADSEQYAVSEFVDTHLYDDRPSYIYGAGVRSLQTDKVIGGIGIVFDAEPEFSAMLSDVVPSSDLVESHSFALFTDKQGKIISSTHKNYQVGSMFAIDEQFFAIENGRSTSKVVKVEGRYYAVGCAKSNGYREYKGENDPHKQEVYAFVLTDIGEAQQVTVNTRPSHTEYANVLSTNQYKTQLATFYVGADWLSFRSEKVLSAVSVDNIVPIYGQEDTAVAGYMMYKGESIALLHTKVLMGASEPVSVNISEAVVVKVGGRKVALSIDGLGDMLDVDPTMVVPVGEDVSVTSKVVSEVVLSNPDAPAETMLQVMDVDLIEVQLKKILSSFDEQTTAQAA